MRSWPKRLAAGAVSLFAALSFGAPTASASTSTYYYDAAGRLIGVTSEHSQIKNYVYDPTDNRNQYYLAVPQAPSSSQGLLANQSIFQSNTLVSANGTYVLSMQNDGNLVLFHGSSVIWQTVTSLQFGATLTMQSGGNLVLFDPQRNVIWQSNTSQAGSQLVVQTDGNVVIYNPSGGAVWSTGTSGK